MQGHTVRTEATHSPFLLYHVVKIYTTWIHGYQQDQFLASVYYLRADQVN